MNSPKLTVKDFFEKIGMITSPKFDLDYTGTFKDSVKAQFKSSKDLNLLYEAVEMLVQTGALPQSFNPHQLTGFKKKSNQRVMECHIKPDWLLVWTQNDEVLTLMLVDTGSHATLFNSNRLKKTIQ
jgi:mRNA interferase YafQ